MTNDSLETLIQLSEMDSQITKLQEAQKKLPLVRTEIQNHILKLTQDLEIAQAKVATFDSEKAAAESWMQEKQEWIKQREERSKDLKTNKEFQASIKEIASAKKEILDKTNALKIAETLKDDAQKQWEQLRATLEPKIAEFKNKQNECDEKMTLVGPKISEKQEERKSLVQKLGQDIYANYTAIQSKVNPALANAASKVCSECGSRIPPQIFNQLHAPEAGLQFCTGCKRILYLKDVEDNS